MSQNDGGHQAAAENEPRPTQPDDPGRQPDAQPAQPNPYSQPMLPPNPYSSSPDYAYGPTPYHRDPLAQAEPGPYGFASPDPYARNSSVQNPPARYPAAGVYPQAPSARGYAAEAMYPPWGPPPPAPAQPRRRSAAPWIAGAVVLVLLLVGGIAGIALGAASHAPALQVEAYLEALTAGNAEEALALSGTGTGGSDPLLTNEAYANARDRITAYTIGDTQVDGNSASVTATLTQGGARYDHEFLLARAGKEALLFDVWTLQPPPLGTVSVGIDAPDDAVVSVGGVDASSARVDDVVELRALPGTYAVSLGGDTTWYEAAPTSASVFGFGAEPEQAEPLVVELTEEGTRSATDAVDDWLDQCIASTEIAPPGCPFSALNTRDYELSNLVWTVTRPVFRIGDFADGSWPVLTESLGEAVVTADARDPSTGRTGPISTEPFAFDIGGVIEGFSADGASYVPAF